MKYINFNHLQEANTNYWHHFKYSGLCTLYCACALPIGIIHTLFPFIGDWLAVEMIQKIREWIEVLGLNRAGVEVMKKAYRQISLLEEENKKLKLELIKLHKKNESLLDY